ncbi:MAG TPA: Ldh family oxidoreductase [Paracoccus sp. (in: a-proteobacteria)]|uniref:Ldh family oxidoreductase n=1 Tax=Paracoccus sp. TaxID=267 RepID=UPI002CFC8643|nr:Ldh family oxidoreductase [Paracoccus sp. (in: a-proteobacteria)]HWL57725.1 Ldh family oxidoreductase [Paracoccus sp. (in: a-proteobacteria)]
MSQRTMISVAQLEEMVVEIFTNAGLSPLQARTVAAVIVAGERDACKSHGIYRIEGCLRTMRAGKVVVEAEPVLTDDGSAVIRVDARGAFSPAAFEIGAPVLAERARKLGLAALVINSCTHFSALWPEIEVLTGQGLAALAMCPSYSTVAPAGGIRPLLGTNPMAFGWPRPGKSPYVFDFATSVAARGEIELHRRSGTPLPEGWAIDHDGKPTTDPQRALEGAMLTFGGHKGSAISTMIELLAGVMIGDLTSPEALDFLGSAELLPHHGELIIAFSPERFAAARPGNVFERAEVLFEAIVGQGARLPSQRRFAARERALAEGIELTAEEVEGLERLRRGA